jgi:hypothetical protein
MLTTIFYRVDGPALRPDSVWFELSAVATRTVRSCAKLVRVPCLLCDLFANVGTCSLVQGDPTGVYGNENRVFCTRWQ